MAISTHPLLAHARRQTPPGPRPHGLLGALPEVAQGRLFELLMHMWRAYGDLTSVRVGHRLMIAVTHPQQLHEVLVSRRELYTKSSHRAAVLLGEGLPASNGEAWSRQRRLLQPFFVPRALAAFDAGIEGALARLVERWEPLAASGEVIDVDREITSLTLDVSLRALSADALSVDHRPLHRAILGAVDYVAASGQLFRLSRQLPTARNRHFRRDLAEIDRFMEEAIRRHRRSPEGCDLLGALLEAQRTGEAWMTDRWLRDEAVSLLLGAYDSTARTITWALALLERAPEVRERLYSEVDPLNGRIPLSADRQALPWTTAVIQEALRLYPAFWVFPRTVARDDTLGGYLIPAGSTVMISPYITQRHPDLWDDPQRFDPARFLGEQSPGARANAIYFGFGPRTCIGNHLALVEGMAALAAIAQRFELSRVGGPVVPEFATTLRPRGGLPMRLRRRFA